MLILAKKVLDCILSIESYFKASKSQARQLCDWLRVKGIVLFTGQKVNKGFSPAFQVSFRETMESYAMWQFIEQVSGLNIEVSYLRVIHTNNLRKEMWHLGKNESIMNTLNNRLVAC